MFIQCIWYRGKPSELVVSSMLYYTVTLIFGLLIPNCFAVISVPECIVDESLASNHQILLRYRTDEQNKKTLSLRLRYVDWRHKNT